MKVSGGGIHAQAGAIRLGVARALVKQDAELKKTLARVRFHDPRFPHGGTQKVRPQKSPQVPPVGETLTIQILNIVKQSSNHAGCFAYVQETEYVNYYANGKIFAKYFCMERRCVQKLEIPI